MISDINMFGAFGDLTGFTFCNSLGGHVIRVHPGWYFNLSRTMVKYVALKTRNPKQQGAFTLTSMLSQKLRHNTHYILLRENLFHSSANMKDLKRANWSFIKQGDSRMVYQETAILPYELGGLSDLLTPYPEVEKNIIALRDRQTITKRVFHDRRSFEFNSPFPALKRL